MNQAVSIRDAALVARFQLSRALRTRSALAVCALYALFSTASALGFVNILHELEKQVARVLHVPETRTPGAMMDALKEDQDFRTMLVNLLGDQRELMDWALATPILTITHFWTCLGLLPVIACAVGAEAVSADIQNRSLRFELVRTGRLEIVAGRFAGQALLLAVALAVGSLCVWLVAMLAMTGNSPVLQATSLIEMTPRLWFWSLPFLGIGVSCSQLTANTNLSRFMALGASQATWVLWALTFDQEDPWLPPVVSDLMLPVLPQGWLLELWGPGLGWALSGAVLFALGWAASLVAFPIFRARNL